MVGDTVADSDAAGALEAEDRARANFYGLISRLFYAPADPNLLAEICAQRRGRRGRGGGSARGVARAAGSLPQRLPGRRAAGVRQPVRRRRPGGGDAVSVRLRRTVGSRPLPGPLARATCRLGAGAAGRRVRSGGPHLGGQRRHALADPGAAPAASNSASSSRVLCIAAPFPFLLRCTMTPSASFYKPVAAVCRVLFRAREGGVRDGRPGVSWRYLIMVLNRAA